jgi:hypothetical protein
LVPNPWLKLQTPTLNGIYGLVMLAELGPNSTAPALGEIKSNVAKTAEKINFDLILTPPFHR